MHIKHAVSDDALTIAQCFVDSGLSSDIHKAEEMIVDEFNTPHHHYLTAHIDSTGHDIMWVISRKKHYRRDHGLAELTYLAVSPHHQWQWIAQQLFHVLEWDIHTTYQKHNHNLRKLFLYTNEDNIRAQTFYQKMWMQKEALMPHHFGDGRMECVYGKYY